MNDRFKFRVWNNKHNRYIVDSHYPIGSDHIIVIRQDGKAYNLGLGDYEDYSNMHSWAVMEEFTDCILEQCTGLKDKNGNLIYEGDVVRFEIVDNDSVLGKTFERICEICFGKGDYSYSFVCKNDAYYRGYALLSSILCQEIENIEIIGNIHEQAEQKN